MQSNLKILYAVQATGNGHIARAEIVLPYLQQYGTVHIMLSGNNSSLPTTLPVTYRSKGLSLFYGNGGGLDYLKIWKELAIKRIYKEAKALPVHDYDIVINDFDCITSLACLLQKKKSIVFGHQASFLSKKSPRPFLKNMMGEIVLQQYAKGAAAIGLHFAAYDNFIFNPIIKQAIIQAQSTNNGHVTVYLGHYTQTAVVEKLLQIPNTIFHVFSKTATINFWHKNVWVQPVSNTAFTQSLITCHGVITGAGFETPAEALYLKKQVLCLPIQGQYEQYCNAAALQKQFNVTIVKKLNNQFAATVQNWLQSSNCKPLQLTHSTQQIIDQVIQKAVALAKTNDQTEVVADLFPQFPTSLNPSY
jgi:uncharacterized protein (TIGR00661 family)